jgi:hypothetical protein
MPWLLSWACEEWKEKVHHIPAKTLPILGKPTMQGYHTKTVQTHICRHYTCEAGRMVKGRLDIWGRAPDPLGRFRRVFGQYTSAKQNNAFCFFFWKKKSISRLKRFLSSCVVKGWLDIWGHAPRPPGSASPSFWSVHFCEAEQRFLLLFLEKEEYQ